MNSKRYKLLGYLVWAGGRWYLRHAYRRRLPSQRKLVIAGGGTLLVTVAAAALLARARS